jgi:hypothetical protein
MRMDRARLGLWATSVLAALVAVGILVQLYLIGAYAFGELDALDTYGDLGRPVHVLEIVVFVAALIAVWPAWRTTAWPFLLAVIGSVQAFLAAGGVDEGSDWVHAFHAALAPIVLLIAILVAWRAWNALPAAPRVAT